VRRRLLNVLTGLSLVLCMAAGVAWVGSYWTLHIFEVRWKPAAAAPTSSGYIAGGLIRPGHVYLHYMRVTDADAAFWRAMAPTRAPAGSRGWAYHAGADGPTVDAGGGFYPDGRRSWDKPWSFRWNSGEEAPSVMRGGSGGTAARIEARAVVVPLWLGVVLGAVLPLSRLRGAVGSIRRTRRAAAGLCTACAYDLRATPGRCPECGTVATASTLTSPVSTLAASAVRAKLGLVE
jgi:hypothetical protein